MTGERRTVRIAAVGDLHYANPPGTSLQPVLGRVSEVADVLALCGDLTDTGLPDEARSLCRELSVLRIPIVAVLGNHDYESDKAQEVRDILSHSGIRVLDGEVVEIQGVGFAGVKGFAGGFGRRALGPWGEKAIKAFVREALDEALKLESALARLRTTRKVALLHYSPILETVEGEPPEIYCYLGSSRLEEPLNRYPVDAVFHGHAHHGRLEGKTSSGSPVHNVSLSLLTRALPGQPPLRVIELEVGGDNGAAPPEPQR